MRKLMMVCGAFLCLSLTAAAQDSTAAFDTSSTAGEPAAPPAFSPSGREAWQLGVGFKYQHFAPFDSFSYHNFAFDSELTRYLNDWIGLEVDAETGFGHTNTTSLRPSLVAKSLFIGGGPHIVLTRSRVEPWGHVLFGLEHLRFTQAGAIKVGTGTIIIGSNSAFGFQAGGGVDFKLGGRVNWRVQADYVGTRFASMIENNYSVGTGLVFNF